MIRRTLGPGRAHLWTEAFMDPNPFMMRTPCGLFADERDLVKRHDAEDCRNCARASHEESTSR